MSNFYDGIQDDHDAVLDDTCQGWVEGPEASELLRKSALAVRQWSRSTANYEASSHYYRIARLAYLKATNWALDRDGLDWSDFCGGVYSRDAFLRRRCSLNKGLDIG